MSAGEKTSVAQMPAFEPRRARRMVPPAERVVAEPGLGSVVYGAAGATLAARPALATAPVRRALVVDDDPEVRRALARFLRPELDVCLAGSVSDAKAIVADLDRLDVAFIDWELPDGTGEQILEWLSRWPDAIRVLISARFTSGASAAAASTSASSTSASSEAASTLPSLEPSAATPCSRSPSEWSHAWSSADPGEGLGARPNQPRSAGLNDNPLKNRALANLVLGKPVATSVIEALKRAALALPYD